MPSFILDPLISTIPQQTEDKTSLSRWIDSLEVWLQEEESSPFSWGHFLQCTYLLIERGRFPTFQALREFAAAHGLDINIAHMVRKISLFFQDSSKDILSIISTKFVIAQQGTAMVLPAELLERNFIAIRDEMMTGLLCLSCDRQIEAEFAKKTHVVTLPFTDAGVSEITVRGTVVLTDPQHISDRMASRCLNETIPVLFSPDDFSDLFNAIDVFGEGHEAFYSALISSAKAKNSLYNKKPPRLVVFAKGKKAQEARDAGADVVGVSDLIERIKAGWIEFDRAIATPDVVDELIAIMPILKAKDIILDAERATVTESVTDTVRKIKGNSLPCKFGSNFWNSLSESGISKDSSALEKLFRICTAVLNNQVKAMNVDVRELRVNVAGDSSPRVRGVDGAHAWRLTITTSGIGWRMHYWHITPIEGVQVESIEFADVLKKQDTEVISE